jgi:hypothetical protein
VGDKENQLVNLRKEQRKQSQGRIQEDSKDRLKKIVCKKMTTTFIFALSEFENVFGQELWGHGLRDSELTSAQQANKKRWEQVRTNILNKGNTQARALEAEMDLHSVEFRGYQVRFGR